MKKSVSVLGFIGMVSLLLTACGGGGDKGPLLPPPPVPAAYADKHMPEGWWTDPKIIEEGKAIFKGEHNIDVNCASCHGKDGKPVKRGARDFRQQARMSMYSDSYWFWRISEGVPKTKMKPWKEKLKEEEIWKVIAYEHTFSHGGQPAPHDDYKGPGEPATASGGDESGEAAPASEGGE
ncbi:MAG TPA: cytochrome c [Nitrospiria bacterium]